MTRKSFLADVAHHRMRVLQDNGLCQKYRHLRFEGDTSARWFEIVTWWGCLAINGHMGTWLFSSISDMFEFFRRPDGSISPDYWREKLIARGEAVAHFSPERFLDEAIETWPDEQERLQESLTGIYSKKEMQETLFELGLPDDEIEDIHGMEYSESFLWCLHAIAWGIDKYDAWKDAQPWQS